MAPIKRNWMMCWIGSVRGLLFFYVMFVDVCSVMPVMG
jgi:hypothetical protein